MAVFRVEKSKDYTVMSNFHLRDSSLSLKAKGLLSQMLSLPEEWDYTLSGLAAINKEGVDAIRAAVQELEQAGYIQRRQTQDENGKFAGNEYVIHESPVCDSPLLDFPTTDNPITENPLTGKPSTEKPLSGKPLSENPTELNIDILNKDLKKKKNKKEKPTKPAPLSEDALRTLVKDYIQRIATDRWSREDKNGLYSLVVELYNPCREVRKAHPMRTVRSVNRTFRNLVCWAGDDPHAMMDIVDRALANGWQGIQQPSGMERSGGITSSGPVRQQEEVQYRCV